MIKPAGRIHLESGDLTVSQVKMDNIDVNSDAGGLPSSYITWRKYKTRQVTSQDMI